MTEVGINRGTDDLTVDFPEVLDSVTEGDDLSRTHKGEIQWIEE